MPVTATPPPGVATSTTAISDVGSPPPGDGVDDLMAAFEQAGKAAAADTGKPAETPAAPPAQTSPTPPTPAQTTPATPAAADDDDPVGRAVERHAGKRDYTGLNEEEVELFKNMSRQSYEKLRPIYDAFKKHGFDTKKFDELNQQLEEQRKFRYHEHPEAYTLADEYKQAQQIVQNIEVVSNFWENQLTALRGGAKEISILQRDAQGRLVPSAPIPVTPQVEAEIIRNLTKVATDAQAAKQELGQLQAQYKSQYDEYGKVFGNVFNQLFGKHEAALKPIAEKQLEKFPPFVRHKPEVKAVAYALATLIAGAADKNAAATSAAADKAVKEASAAAGPTTGELAAGPKTKAPAYDEKEYKNFKAEFMIQ